MKHSRPISKILVSLLALLLCLSFLVSCNDTPTPPDDTSEDASTVSLPADETTSEETGDPDTLTIVKDEASEYRIIFKESWSNVLTAAVDSLRKAVMEKTGVSLDTHDDFEHAKIPGSAATDYEILVGTTREGKYFDTSALPELTIHDYYITVIGTRILILGGSPSSTARGVSYFIANYLPEDGAKSWTLPCTTEYLKEIGLSGQLTIMSFNLLHGGTSYKDKKVLATGEPVDESVHTIAKRRPRVREIILSNMPDVIGMQEVSNWHDFLDTDSELVAAGYKLLRCGKNKKISIYYNTNTLTSLESGSIYLTEDPENLKCSVEWNSDGNPRLAHFVRFRINATGETFIAVNTHIGFENATLQTNQTLVVANYCKQLSEKYGNDPVVCVGDFNSAKGSAHYSAFIDHGFMEDSYSLADSAKAYHSFHGYGSANVKASAIDQVMVSKDDWTVFSYKVDTTMFGTHVYYSDHFAVVSSMILNPKE